MTEQLVKKVEKQLNEKGFEIRPSVPESVRSVRLKRLKLENDCDFALPVDFYLGQGLAAVVQAVRFHQFTHLTVSIFYLR
jgi:hypothetical protein